MTEAPTAAAAERLVERGDVDAAILPSDDPLGYKVVGLDDAPTDVVQALSVAPRIELLDPNAIPVDSSTSSRWRSASCTSPRP